MEKIIGVLGNITEKEMEIAVKAIERDRDEKTRVAEIKRLEQVLYNTIKQIHSMNGRVIINGAGYVPACTTVNEHANAHLKVFYY